MVCHQIAVPRCAVRKREHAESQNISITTGTAKKKYLSHGFPIIKAPIDRFIVRDFDSSYILCASAAIYVGPNKDGGTGAVTDTVRRVTSTGLLKNIIPLLRPHIQGVGRQLSKGCGEVQIEPFARR
jgi:hypothetical protein